MSDRSRRYGDDREQSSRHRQYDDHNNRKLNRSHSRSRSRSPKRRSPDRRNRSRSRSRSRDRRNRSPDDRKREREKSDIKTVIPETKQSAAQSREQTRKERMSVLKRLVHDGSSDEEGAVKDGKEDEVDWGGEGLTADEDILRVMGFTGFDTTKEKPVADNVKTAAIGTAARNKRRIYRQYMNRRGGFNRPLQKLN